MQTFGENDARDLFAGTEMIKQPGFDGRSTPGASELDLLWTPDGQSLVFSATRNANRGAYDFTNTELWQIAIDGGEPRRLTGSEELKGGDGWSEPKFSPDGRSLYALREVRGKRVFSPTHLVAFDWPARAGASVDHAAGRARSDRTSSIAPNNRDIYMLAEDSGHIEDLSRQEQRRRSQAGIRDDGRRLRQSGGRRSRRLARC